jgi:hypothetical protein
MKKRVRLTKLSYFVIFLLVLFFMLGFAPLYFGLKYLFESDNINLLSLSNLGQYLGGTSGVLFYIAATMSVILAFLVQRTQIKIQKNEIEKNNIREEIRNFENNFYQSINIHIKILELIIIPDTMEKGILGNKICLPIEHRGVRALEKIYKKFYELCIKNKNAFVNSNLTLEERRIMFNESYINFLKEHLKDLGHYFRNLFHILKIIYVNKNILKDNGKYYSNILRAQLSAFELIFLFYNGISDLAKFSSEELNFKKMIEYFNFFEHLRLSEFFDNSESREKDNTVKLLSLYNLSAYGENYYEIISSLKS